MKSVLISIQPKWVEKIASGEKTIEVRKTRPKLETPFKCYIYCTNNGGTIHSAYDGLHYHESYVGENDSSCINGKVIGEFVCDRIIALYNVATSPWNLLAGNIHEHAKNLVRNACLTEKEMHDYAKGKNCYAWHISELKIYDKPKELGEFKRWVNDKDYDGWNEQRTKIVKGFVLRPLTRPPRSWQHVEENEDER